MTGKPDNAFPVLHRVPAGVIFLTPLSALIQAACSATNNRSAIGCASETQETCRLAASEVISHQPRRTLFGVQDDNLLESRLSLRKPARLEGIGVCTSRSYGRSHDSPVQVNSSSCGTLHVMPSLSKATTFKVNECSPRVGSSADVVDDTSDITSTLNTLTRESPKVVRSVTKLTPRDARVEHVPLHEISCLIKHTGPEYARVEHRTRPDSTKSNGSIRRAHPQFRLQHSEFSGKASVVGLQDPGDIDRVEQKGTLKLRILEAFAPKQVAHRQPLYARSARQTFSGLVSKTGSIGRTRTMQGTPNIPPTNDSLSRNKPRLQPRDAAPKPEHFSELLSFCRTGPAKKEAESGAIKMLSKMTAGLRQRISVEAETLPSSCYAPESPSTSYSSVPTLIPDSECSPSNTCSSSVYSHPTDYWDKELEDVLSHDMRYTDSVMTSETDIRLSSPLHASISKLFPRLLSETREADAHGPLLASKGSRISQNYEAEMPERLDLQSEDDRGNKLFRGTSESLRIKAVRAHTLRTLEGWGAK